MALPIFNFSNSASYENRAIALPSAEFFVASAGGKSVNDFIDKFNQELFVPIRRK